jgi:carboxyl-terminal processing protease
VLLQMKWASKDAVDLSGMDAEEVSELLDQSNTEKLELTIRKKSGEIQKVILQKRKLENEENIVKSYLLKGEKNIGYITLPSFYTQWEESSGSRCASDVAREIIKLNKDNISGLILDLRFNGGGSLQEAVEMAGIFIDEGAICELGMKDGKTVVLKDMNRGVIYSGPMIVMVNGYSASASELLAGSLQDYNRALIVGSKTFGKATGQEMKQLGTDASTRAVVKLTNLRLYRVTGKSIQMQGVIPDVVLPDPYTSFGERESDNKFSIRPDTVARYKYFKPLKEIQKNGLQQLSEARVKNAKFKALDDYTQAVIQGMKKEKISLKWDAVEKEVRESKVSVTEKSFAVPTTVFSTGNNSSDQKLIGNDEIAKEINQRWLQRIAQDPYIEETYQIMLDLIKIN